MAESLYLPKPDPKKHHFSLQGYVYSLKRYKRNVFLTDVNFESNALHTFI